MSTVEHARRALGDRLRALRMGAAMTGADLAAATGWPASKISKLELGQQLPTPADIKKWCAITNSAHVERDLQAALANLQSMVNDARRAARASLTGRQERQLELERRSRQIRIFNPVLIPSPLQDETYARSVLAQSAGLVGADAIEVSTAATVLLRRQADMLTGDQRIEVLIAEQALHTTVRDGQTTAAQLECLLSLESSVRWGVIPRDALWIHGLAPMTIYDDIVITETLFAEMELTNAAGLAAVERVWDALRGQAQYGTAAAVFVESALNQRR